MKNTDTLQGRLLRLLFPITFQQFMMALVGVSDALMLGSLSQESMAAVSLATQTAFVFQLFLAAFGIGENMFVAQYYGKKDYAGISKIAGYCLRLSCGTAFVFFAGAVFFPMGIMRLITDVPELIALGGEYLRYVGVSFLLSAAAQVHMTLMRNCGAVSLSTLIGSTAVVLNIALNAMLIYGLFGMPALGIRGAALATVTVSALQALWSIAYVTGKMRQVRICLWERGGMGEAVRRFWEKVAPVLLNELVWGGGFTMYSVIMGHLGTDAVAANSMAGLSKNLVVCLCMGLGSAGSIVVGNELGAGHFEEAKRAGRMLTRAAILCGILSGALLLALSPVITAAVSLTPAAKEYLRIMLVLCSIYLVGKAVNSMTIGGIFPAGGDSRFGLLCDAVTLWGFTIPLGCLCAFVWKLPVPMVYLVLNLDEIVKLPAVYRHYRKYGWVKNIT